MRFEIPFNAENDYQEKLFLWKFTWLKKIRVTWYYTILLFAIVLLLLFVQNNHFLYTWIIALLIGLILSYVRSLIFLEKHKKTYLQNTKIRSQTLTDTIINYEFNEDCFVYSDKFLSYTISWKELQDFKSSANILLMKRKYTEQYAFIISKKDFGEVNYLEIVDFLKTKIPQQIF